MSLYRKAVAADFVRIESSEPRPAAVLTTTHGPHDPVLTVSLTQVNTNPAAGQPTPAAVFKDRHKPGYMAEYMRKRRAKK